MTGLDKIINEIQNEAAAEASANIAKAKSEAEAILSKAKTESDAAVGAVGASAARDVKEIERSRKSAQQLQQRQRTLRTKQELLAETLARAKEGLHVLSDVEYFILLVKLAAASAQQGEGNMMLNEADTKRLPADFENLLAAALPKGASLKVSSETRPIDGGFVLKYGDVEENCSFTAIFDARRDEFYDLARETLFA